MTDAPKDADREEREIYRKKHAAFRREMNKALWAVEREAILSYRPQADRYVLAEYKRGTK